jgi:thiol-disulfide isomerase/thioredoxin
MTSLLKNLPSDIVRHIYEYDNTYRDIFTNSVIHDIRKYSWKRLIQKYQQCEWCEWCDETVIKIEYVLNYFAEKNRNDCFPDDIIVKVRNYEIFTNIRISQKKDNYNSNSRLYRVYTREQALPSLMKINNFNFREIDSNKDFILFEY